MRFAFQTRWLRLLIELFPAPSVIRHHRALPSRVDADVRRLLQRRITRKLRHDTTVP